VSKPKIKFCKIKISTVVVGVAFLKRLCRFTLSSQYN